MNYTVLTPFSGIVHLPVTLVLQIWHMKLKQLFTARSDRFYNLFEEVAKHLVDMSRLFQQVAYSKESRVDKTLIQQIEKLEHANDRVTHQLFLQLSRNFITP